jgi:hypothetical protein
MAKIFAQFADGSRREANEDTAGRLPMDWIDACRRNEAPCESTLENWLLMAGLQGDYCEIERDTGRVWCGRNNGEYDQGYLLSQEECDEYMARIERGV